jgi:gluconolactonase
MNIEMLVETDAHEGPVYAADEHALYFTTNRPNVAICCVRLATGAVETVRADANMANGMTMGPDGRLLVCEQGTKAEPARITALDRFTGAIETLVDGWRGQPLNSPNDIAVRGDGTIWFTDPSYGWLQGFRPEPQLPDAVYRYDPTSGALDRVAEGFDKPNGLAFSPDQQVLYVGDSGAPHAVSANGELFAVIRPGYPDGLKVDRDGRVHVTCATGLQVFAPDGGLLEEIPLPGAVNFTFGGDLIYVTADDAIWTVTR